MTQALDKNRESIGWREWVSLPKLKISRIKAKIDTGAKTSSIHAEDIEFLTVKGKDFVRFTLYPMQGNHLKKKRITSEVVDYRRVRSSNGLSELRPVILTDISMGRRTWLIEITLTNRDLMGFRLLLGREALKNRFIIYPGKSFLLSIGSGKKSL